MKNFFFDGRITVSFDVAGLNLKRMNPAERRGEGLNFKVGCAW